MRCINAINAICSRVYPLLAVSLALIARPGAARADDDIVILLDQSASMLEKAPGDPGRGYALDPRSARKSRDSLDAIEYVVEKIVRRGDYFSLIRFGDSAKIVSAQQILHEHERELVKGTLAGLSFGDRKTDIVAGVVSAGSLLQALGDPQRRKILVVITDGKNDPPDTSPYQTEPTRLKAYQELRDTIRFNKWNVKLVGLGQHTDITEIANRLGLPADRTLNLDDQTPGTIASNIKSLVQDERDNLIEMSRESENVTIRLRPRLLGGYVQGRQTIKLTSRYPHPVEVALDTLSPVTTSAGHSLAVTASPVLLKLGPKQQASLELFLDVTGPAPSSGQIDLDYAFQFAEGSIRFYPFHGRSRVLLTGWWETYGMWTSVLAAALAGFMALAAWLWWKAQIPELRISIGTESQILAGPFLIRKGEHFKFANGDLSPRTVPAGVLACKDAARVQYTGRRRFLVRSLEARLLLDGKETAEAVLTLDEPFDLKDTAGKSLRNITITTGDLSDIGGPRDSEPL